MPSSSTGRFRQAVLILVVLGCIGCDQATKSLATAALQGKTPRFLLGDVLELRYAENTGGFLSLGARLSAPVRNLVFVVAVSVLLAGLAVFVLRDRSLVFPQLLAAAFIIAGGFSNLIDRIALGYVRDFAVLRFGPLRTGVFNLADVAVTLGCIAFVVWGWHSSRPRCRGPFSSPASPPESAAQPPS
jgi:signal peptidase II